MKVNAKTFWCGKVSVSVSRSTSDSMSRWVLPEPADLQIPGKALLNVQMFVTPFACA